MRQTVPIDYDSVLAGSAWRALQSTIDSPLEGCPESSSSKTTSGEARNEEEEEEEEEVEDGRGRGKVREKRNRRSCNTCKHYAMQK